MGRHRVRKVLAEYRSEEDRAEKGKWTLERKDIIKKIKQKLEDYFENLFSCKTVNFHL